MNTYIYVVVIKISNATKSLKSLWIFLTIVLLFMTKLDTDETCAFFTNLYFYVLIFAFFASYKIKMFLRTLYKAKQNNMFVYGYPTDPI